MMQCVFSLSRVILPFPLLQLRNVLDALVCSRPDVGYVQGMSYLGAMICLYTDSP